MKLEALQEAHPEAEEVELWAQDEARLGLKPVMRRVGSGGREAHSPLQERLQVDLSLWLRPSEEWEGLLDDPAHGKHGVDLFGIGRVRLRRWEPERRSASFWLWTKPLAHWRGGADPGRHTP
jgi:hypothetical protein